MTSGLSAILDRRPIMVVIAGPNGAGKSTFHDAHLSRCGLRFINADILARELDAEVYQAAGMADALRRILVAQGESFVFETVFSDPVGAKLAFMRETVAAGYTVVLCFIGISSVTTSEARVAMRVSQGGHDVPTSKLVERLPRTMANLAKAIVTLPHVWIFDNDDLRSPFRLAAVFERSRRADSGSDSGSVPEWLRPLLPSP